MHPVPAFPPRLLNISSNIIFHFTPVSSEWSFPFWFYNRNIVCICHLPCVLHAHPSYPPWWSVQFTKLFIMRPSGASLPLLPVTGITSLIKYARFYSFHFHYVHPARFPDVEWFFHKYSYCFFGEVLHLKNIRLGKEQVVSYVVLSSPPLPNIHATSLKSWSSVIWRSMRQLSVFIVSSRKSGPAFGTEEMPRIFVDTKTSSYLSGHFLKCYISCDPKFINVVAINH
jgi:hypothetical protein